MGGAAAAEQLSLFDGEWPKNPEKVKRLPDLPEDISSEEVELFHSLSQATFFNTRQMIEVIRDAKRMQEVAKKFGGPFRNKSFLEILSIQAGSTLSKRRQPVRKKIHKVPFGGGDGDRDDFRDWRMAAANDRS